MPKSTDFLGRRYAVTQKISLLVICIKFAIILGSFGNCLFRRASGRRQVRKPKSRYSYLIDGMIVWYGMLNVIVPSGGSISNEAGSAPVAVVVHCVCVVCAWSTTSFPLFKFSGIYRLWLPFFLLLLLVERRLIGLCYGRLCIFCRIFFCLSFLFGPFSFSTERFLVHK
jgi:hypothetical protein